MDYVLEQISEWLRNILVTACMDNLSGLFDAVNAQVGQISSEVGTTPAAFSPGVYSMIRNISVFDVAQHVVNASGGLIGNTSIDGSAIAGLQAQIEEMEVGPLLGLFLQTLIVRLLMWIFSLAIFVIVYGRMIEIYLMTSLAPIPFSTFGNREQSQIGQNYFKSLMALGFQGFLIMICVGIYAVLIRGVSFSSDIIASIWGVMGYTVLLCFTLFKTGSLAKSVFSAH